MPTATASAVTATLDSATFAAAVRNVAPVVTGKNVQPEHAAVAISVTDGTMTVRATSLYGHRAVTFDVSDQFDTDLPEVALPARKFSQLVGMIDGDTVRITHDPAAGANGEDRVIVAAGRSTHKVSTLDADHLVVPPDISGNTSVEVSAPGLKQIIKLVAYAADADAIKPTRAVRLSTADGRLRAVATDGHRVASASIVTAATTEVSTLIAASDVSDAVNTMLDGAETVTVSIGERHCGFATDGNLAVVRLVDGKYPNVDKVLDALEADSTVTVPDARVLAEDIKRAIVLADATHVVFEFDEEDATARAAAAQAGDGDVALLCALDGPAVTLAVNHAYIVQALDKVGARQVELLINAPLKPFLIDAGEDDDGVEFKYLVMPMRV